jgi:hypothetical protein
MITTTTITFRQLENLAIAAHARGESWSTFWETVNKTVARMAEGDPIKFRRLVDRLLSVLVSGDTSGLEPPTTEPWELDDDTQLPGSSSEARADRGTGNRCKT